MRTPKRVRSIELQASCVGITQREWDSFMKGTTKANGNVILGLLKKHLPELDDDLMFGFYNPYIEQCRKKEGLLVYVHSGIEYFFTYS